MPLKTADDVISYGTIADAVDYAVSLSRELQATVRELEQIKRYLRDEAIQRAAQSGERTAKLEGSLGTAQIVFSKPLPRARRGADLSVAEKLLPLEVFRKLFCKRIEVTISPDFEEEIRSLTLAQRMVVQKLVRIVPSTPRLQLPE